MPDAKPIPYTKPTNLVTTAINIDGKEVPGKYLVMSMAVLKEINRIASSKIILIDGEAAKKDFPASNEKLFIPGKKIELLAGYHSYNQTIFKGIIIKHTIRIRNGESFLILECKDDAVKMTVGRKSKYFADKTDSEAAEELIGTYKIDNKIESTDVKHKELVQFDCTDWDFMISRLEANGKVCTTDNGKIIAKKPMVEKEPLFDLTYGDNIFDFDAEIDARNQVKAVKAGAWSYSDQSLTESDGAEPKITEQGNLSASEINSTIDAETYLQHSGKLPQDELQAWADSQLMKNRLSKIRGRVKFQGFAGIKPGDTIRLNGVGDRFNGLVYVSGVRHDVAKGNWMTDLQFGLTPEWFTQSYPVSHLPAAGLLPSIHGLHTGVVTDLEDPDGEDRIRVRIPVISVSDEGVWSRISSLDAGNSRGMYFRPEIDDEVIVGFVNNDPRHPVVLGMLNSSANAAHLKASNSNPQKGYKSRSGMKFIFDDQKKSVTLETPKGKKIIVDEMAGVITLEDENSNKITMDLSGVKVEAARNIELNAPKGDVNIVAQNISFKCTTGLKVDGGLTAEIKSGSLKIDGGASAEIKGATFTAEGSASAEINSKGVMTLKGSVININ